MRERLKLLVYYAGYWLTFQLLARAIFLIYNYDLTRELSAAEVLKVFLHGIRMDISMSGYWIMFTALMLTISMITTSRWPARLIHGINILALIVSSIVVVVDLELYRHWGFRLNTTPLFYVGSEALGSVDATVVIRLIAILMALVAGFLLLYFRYVIPRVKQVQPPTHRTSTLVLLGVTGAMILPIRGSLSVAPMNSGFVYFHKTKSYANHSAINATWNFLYSVQSDHNIEYPENFYDKTRSERYFSNLYATDDSTVNLLTSSKPNIVFFILESFTADVIEPLGGVKDVAPTLSKLCSEGVLFDNFYASGDRTDKGLVSILSGYPAQPRTSIIKYPAKTHHLPNLNHHLRKLGYHTSFIYGGDVDFANFRSYLTSCQFDHITSDEDFPGEWNESKWGVHDHLVFDRALTELDTTTGPFFKVILSLSSHEPFDVPMKPKVPGQSEESMFLNSVYYTDQCLAAFIDRARQKPWWNNTLMIFVADHGHRHPRNKELKDKERFRIPFLMIGNVVKKDTVIHTYASQTDIANTLLSQLANPSSDFKFSNNALSPEAKSFAYYFFNDGYGMVAPDKYIIYDNTGRQFLRREGVTEEELEESKGYQQILFSDYNRK